MNNLKAAVVGATGYTGVELIRLLLDHPNFELTSVTSRSNAGERVDALYPALVGFTDLIYEDKNPQELSQEVDVVFLAVPHKTAMNIAPEFINNNVKVIDLSADFRLKSKDTYEAWYDTKHVAPELLEKAVYGLPEITFEKLKNAQLVASPGCYPTASSLATIPLFDKDLANTDTPVIISAISGISGAGKSPCANNLFCNVGESAQAYSAGTHRHTPEISQTLSYVANKKIQVSFTPHLAPMNRGLLATAYIQLKDKTLTLNQVVDAYTSFYSDKPFVHVLDKHPRTDYATGTNNAFIGVSLDAATNTVIASCAIDNLVKGSGGQSVQCANIMFGLDQTTGLNHPMPVV